MYRVAARSAAMCRVLALASGANLACGLWMAALAYDDPVLVQGDVAIGYDDNVANASLSADRRSDEFAEAGGRLNGLFNLNRFTSLELEGSLRGRQYRQYDDLEYLAPQVIGRVNYRPAAGFRTPTLSFWGSLERREYGSDLRDSVYYRSGLTLKQPVTTRVTVNLHADYNRRSADNEVFDYDFYSAALDLEWEPTADWLFASELRRREGDVVSSSADGSGLVDAARAWIDDDAFDDTLAYRLRASVNTATLEAHRSLTDNLDIDASVQHSRARSEDGIEYRRTILMVGAGYRF